MFDTNKKVLKPERTWNYIVGYRYDSQFFSGSADFYHTDYYNRLASITEGSTATAHSAYLNVGRETMNGADAVVTIDHDSTFQLRQERNIADHSADGSGVPDTLVPKEIFHEPAIAVGAKMSARQSRHVWQWKQSVGGPERISAFCTEYALALRCLSAT